MIDFGSMNQSTIDLFKQISLKKEAEALQKEKEATESRIKTLESSLANFQDKAVTQTSTPSTPITPAPAKSMTLMHVGLLAGGVLLGYLVFKMAKK